MKSFIGKLHSRLSGRDRGHLEQKVVPLDPLQKYLDTGVACLKEGRFEAARGHFSEILRDHPDCTQAMHFLGILSAQAGDFASAAEWIGKAVRIGPPDAEMFSNLGNALRGLGRDAEARAAYEQAIAADPGFTLAFVNHGSICFKMGDVTAAEASVDQLLSLQPKNVDGWLARGDVCFQIGRHEEALECYERGIALNPASLNAQINRGSALTELRRFDLAVEAFRKVIAQDPENFIAHYNLGTVMLDGLLQPTAALPHFDAAIRIKPEYGPAYHNRAHVLDELGRYSEAIFDYQTALSLGSGTLATFGMMVYSKMRICAWEGLSNDFDYIVEGFEREQKKATAFMMLAATGELSTQRVIANLFSKVLHTDAPSMSAIERYPRHDRIRVGYFSADLRNHPVAYLTAELFELHDPELFEIVVFSFGPYDAMTSRVNMAVEDYIDVRTLTNEDVVNLARSLEIDIAIDLGGYTARNRSEVFAMRVAPVQISYLGYPGTMGDGMHDYLIADRVLVPTESEHFYSEKIIRLPVYQINDSKRKISSRVFSRAELGLPATGFVYCCFNSTIKFNPQIFDVWMRILARVPGSVLFLLSSGQEANDNIRREAEARGVSKDRIVLGGKLERPEYLARYRACDLFLDTLPFNAGTTASDALWAGLPVLTCAGEAFASRMAASLLTALELPELITSTFDEYEQRAVDIADNPARLDALRGRLQQNVRSGLLFDTRLVARSIESAYMAVYERYQSGLLPESIEISS